MTTRLFDTVNLYDSSNAINASPAEMLLIDLATIGDNVVVTVPDASSPVAMRPRVGQVIGVQVFASSGSFSVSFAGPVANALAFPVLQQLNAAVLLTWDPDVLGGAWVLTAANNIPPAPALPKLFETILEESVSTTVNPDPATMVILHLTLIGADTTVTFPATATDGECIGIQIFEASGQSAILAGPVQAPSFALNATGDCALWTWTTDLMEWELVSYSRQSSGGYQRSAFISQSGPVITQQTTFAELALVEITTDGAASNLLLDCSVAFEHTDPSADVAFRLTLDSNPLTSEIVLRTPSLGNSGTQFAFTWRETGVAAGNHTIVLEWRLLVQTNGDAASASLANLRAFATSS